MLQITVTIVPEGWDEKRQEFVEPKTQTLQLEHSLVSLRKWESKWCKAFLSKKEKTLEETVDYIKCMTLTQNVNPETYNYLTKKHIDQINEYISAPMTATYFYEEKTPGQKQETVTAELIYYWMIALQIPFECQKWHLNQLMALIKVCNIKNAPPKKMSRQAMASRNAALNEARRKQWGTSG